MDTRKQRRRNGKIDRLEPTQKDTVNQMLLSGASYREVVEYLQEHDVQISRTAVCTYAKQTNIQNRSMLEAAAEALTIGNLAGLELYLMKDALESGELTKAFAREWARKMVLDIFGNPAVHKDVV